jgi:tryptophan-rich sensory protein
MIGITPDNWIGLIVFASIAGILLWNGSRYRFVRRQTFPPPWVFAVAWTILYPAIGIAGFLFWQTGEGGASSSYIYQSGLSLWVVQIALNVLWIVVYCQYQSAKAALAVILLLLLASASCTGVFITQAAQIANNGSCIAASVLMGLYVLWIAMACIFNALEVRAERKGIPLNGERLYRRTVL